MQLLHSSMFFVCLLPLYRPTVNSIAFRFYYFLVHFLVTYIIIIFFQEESKNKIVQMFQSLVHRSIVNYDI